MVRNHLRARQRQPQAQGRPWQVLPREIGRLKGIIRTAVGHADAWGVVAGAALGAPVNDPVGSLCMCLVLVRHVRVLGLSVFICMYVFSGMSVFCSFDK